MKKTLAILLALVAIGGFAFAQGKVVVGIDGKTTLIDQTYDSATAYYNNTYVNGLAFSAVDAANVKGASISFNESFNLGALTVANYKGYWNFFDNKAKVSIGNFSMSDYRTSALMSADNGKLGGGQIEQVMLQAYPVAGLSLGVQLPYAQTAKPVETILKTSAFGASYAIDKVGTAKAYVNLGLENVRAMTIGAGFDYTGTDKLEVVALYEGVKTTSLANKADISATYSMDKLSLAAEGLMNYTTDLTYTVMGEVAYAVNANIAPAVDVSFDSVTGIDVSGTVPYDFLNGVTLKGIIGYTADALYWSVPLCFSVSF